MGRTNILIDGQYFRNPYHASSPDLLNVPILCALKPHFPVQDVDVHGLGREMSPQLLYALGAVNRNLFLKKHQGALFSICAN